MDMTQRQIYKTTKYVIPIFLIPFVIGIFEAWTTSNEFGLSDFILSNLLIPIVVLSTIMSSYWILLTDEFWDLYEGIDKELWTITKTVLKFLVCIPGMGLCFFADVQGFLSIYNRTAGDQKLTSISGRIIDKDQYRNRCYFEINDSRLGRKVEIRINATEFEEFNVGDNYSTERKIGGLGFIYESK